MLESAGLMQAIINVWLFPPSESAKHVITLSPKKTIFDNGVLDFLFYYRPVQTMLKSISSCIQELVNSLVGKKLLFFLPVLDMF